MPAERYFVDDHLEDSKTVLIEDQEFHHLCHVMRTKPGDTIEIVNGKWQLATGVVQKVGKKDASIFISSVETRIPELKKLLILAQAIPRFSRLEYIIEKATELNAAEIWLFPGELSEKEHFTTNQQQRMSQIAISAMKQCGRLDLPEIKLMPPLKEWKTFYPSSFFGDTRKEAPFLWDLSSKSLSSEEPQIFFIGPEKGFHPREIDLLENKVQAKGIKLHINTLRVDTASFTALSYLWANLHRT